MNEIAYQIGDTIIHWNSILIGVGIVAGFLIGLGFYTANHKFSVSMWLYLPLSIVTSIFAARAIHWYCNMEHYESFQSAMQIQNDGGYCIVGVLFGTWFVALLLAATRIVKSPYEILDAIAPGIAFVLGMIRFSDIYSDSCRGKFVLTDARFFKLPVGIPMRIGGAEEYRLAAFFISFLFLMLTMILVSVFRLIVVAGRDYRYGIKASGHTYRMFLLLYSMSEIFIDSIRYDSEHLFFSGEALANLNKGASFMGLSQFVAALVLIYLAIYYFVRAIKERHSKTAQVFLLILFIVGLIMAGVSEYLVQRYSGMYVAYYSVQIAGILFMGLGIYFQHKNLLMPKE